MTRFHAIPGEAPGDVIYEGIASGLRGQVRKEPDRATWDMVLTDVQSGAIVDLGGPYPSLQDALRALPDAFPRPVLLPGQRPSWVVEAMSALAARLTR